MIKAREITIDPQDDHIRIYIRWVHEENLAFDPIMLEIADRIALYIKKIVHKSG
jgi:AraC-like DNA-binding protein